MIDIPKLPEILAELESITQWVNFIRIWNPEKHDGTGGYDKPPINPRTLWSGSTRNAAQWTDYKTAAANIGKTAHHRDQKHLDPDGQPLLVEQAVEGCGLVLASGYCGVDFDDVIDDRGNVAPWALEIVERLDTYTEISPSGHGLHSLLFCEDLLNAGKDFGRQFILTKDGRITDTKRKESELEIYFYVQGGRYLTVTGNIFRNRPINRRKGQELRKLYEEYREKQREYKAARSPQSVCSQSGTVSRTASDEADRKMIESALAAIDPGELDGFEAWAPIMTALKTLGYSLDDADKWSKGDLCGSPNTKNDSTTNLNRWASFKFGNPAGAAAVIVSAAKMQGWNPADAFDDDERTEYGRSLYTEEERREYGRKKHEQKALDWWNRHKDDFEKWQKERKER